MIHVSLTRNSYTRTHTQMGKKRGKVCNCTSLEVTYLRNLSQEFSSVAVLTEAPDLLSEKKSQLQYWHLPPPSFGSTPKPPFNSNQ